MAPLIAAAPAIASLAGAGFSIFKGIKSLTSGGGSRESQPQPFSQRPTPQVAASSAARKRRRIGRNALILSDQEDILGEPAVLGRSQLTAV